jgi:transcriptional regulator with XRE-family HTH domain
MSRNPPAIEYDAVTTRVALRLRAIRLESGETITAIANRAGISKGYLSTLEHGNACPTVEMLVRLARAYGVSTRTMIPGDL